MSTAAPPVAPATPKSTSTHPSTTTTAPASSPLSHEISHYVVTAHPPGSVLLTTKCNFLAPDSTDVLVAKSRRLEVRQVRLGPSSQAPPFPVVLQVPIHGRLTGLQALSLPNVSTAVVFVTTERFQYAALVYDPTVLHHNNNTTGSTSSATHHAYPIRTLASGSLQSSSTFSSASSSSSPQDLPLARQVEPGPMVAVDHANRCIAMHVFEGLLTVIPMDASFTLRAGAGKGPLSSSKKVLGEPFHVRMEERTVLAMTFLQSHHDPLSESTPLPALCLLYQDARGIQHVTTHVIHPTRRELYLQGSTLAPVGTEWLKRNSVDGGSSLLISLPPPVRLPHTTSTNTTAAAAPAPDASFPPPVVVPPVQTTGGVVVIGQRQLTFVSTHSCKVQPIPQALVLTVESLPADPTGKPRYLLGDEFGNLHMLTIMTAADKVVALHIETLGSCTLATSLAYLGEGLVFCGSALGDSQLVQIHDEPIRLMQEEGGMMMMENEEDLVGTTYLSVVEEYTQLGPILDFDLVPTTPGQQVNHYQVVTASGSSKSGSIRLIRNGIGMHEYASVEIPGIQHMWSLRKSFGDFEDAYLVQAFVGETRVLGVTAVPTSRLPVDLDEMHEDDHDDDDEEEDEEEEMGGTLEEVVLPGLDSTVTTLYVGNVQAGDRLLQITKGSIRLVDSVSGHAVLDTWEGGAITVATANEAGQIAVALTGGQLIYLIASEDKLQQVSTVQMAREVSCLDIHPFSPVAAAGDTAMEVDSPIRLAHKSGIVAVGLWDDYTVRVLSLDNALEEMLCIHLSTEEDPETEDADGPSSRRNRSTNMMARSLSLVTLDFSNPTTGTTSGHNSNSGGHSSTPGGVNMLFVGLGDGTLVSFAVVANKGVLSVQSKKEVCLGTQRIDLVPLNTEGGGTCILATGDRPTVIYLAGGGGTSANQFNPKLCYSNVNLSASDEEEGDDVSRPPSQQSIAVNVAAPFFSPLLFDAAALGTQHYSLCVADDANLKLGVIDDIQKLHVTTCRLGMSPRRIVHCPDARLFAVGCIESGIKHFGVGGDDASMANCVRIMDDTSFDDIQRIDLEPFEIILSMVYATLKVPSTEAADTSVTSEVEATGGSGYKTFLLVGTAYAIPDEDEPTRGRILVYSCQPEEGGASNSTSRMARLVTEFSVTGGVYSMTQFFEGKLLCTVNSRTHICHLVEETGILRLEFVGVHHHGHILSLFVRSRAKPMSIEGNPASSSGDASQSLAMEVAATETAAALPTDSEANDSPPPEMLAIVGDLMRSISLVQYYSDQSALEEVARDFNANWTTAVEMLNDHIFLGAENWNNLFCLRRNTASNSEEVRCRLDTIGEFHLGEMCNKFMTGSLVMPVSSNNNTNSSRRAVRRGHTPEKKSSSDVRGSAGRIGRPVVATGSQTLFGTVDGSLGVILGLDGRTTAFFSTLERAMGTVIRPVGDFSHSIYRACHAERRAHPAHGFIDGDLVESFLDLDRTTMEAVVAEMNRDGSWEVDDVTSRSNRESDGAGEDSHVLAELSVDDVLAMVEEMTMLH